MKSETVIDLPETAIIALGTASVVTLGDGAGGEPNGQAIVSGISED